MMSSIFPVTVSIIGAGNMAPEHIRAFQDVPGVTVAGIHSRTRARAEALAAEFSIPLVCDSVTELQQRTQADLVVVTVFEMAMREVATECCQYPWAVLLEKPPGMNLAEASEIQQAAEAHGCRVLVGLNRRFLSSTQTVLDDLAARSGRRYIHVQDQQSLQLAQSLNHPQKVVDHWMYANSIHLVDYLPALGRGEVEQVDVIEPWDPNQPGVVLAKVKFSSGDLGLYEGIWDGPGPWACTVVSPEVRWELRPLEKASFQLAGERRLQSVEPNEADSRFKPGFRLQADHAVRYVRGEPSQSPTLTAALRTMSLISQIYSVG